MISGGGEIPRVDVVIPAYNAEHFIENALESALSQSGVEVHTIVVDAASTDQTLARIHVRFEPERNPRLTVISLAEKAWAGAGRNIGASKANGPWLTFLDADDSWSPDTLRSMIACIEDASIEIGMTHLVPVHQDEGSDCGFASQHHQPVAACAGGFVVSLELFKQVGPFAEDLMVGEVVDWLARARALGVRERLARQGNLMRRTHEANTSRERSDSYPADVLELVKRYHRLRTIPAELARD